MFSYPVYETYRVGAAVAERLPMRTVVPAERLGALLGRIEGPRRRQVIRNLRRIHGPDFDGPELEAAIRRTFGYYTRYWVESFKLPGVSKTKVDVGFSVEGLEHLLRALDGDKGPLMVIPHLGGWEWAAYWVTEILGHPITAVVEPVEPPELFEWFAGYRRSLGMEVVPLGPEVAGTVARAIKDRHVICLLTDRDITGTGVEVEFFGERTTLPSGPATLALRTGAPLLPIAIYFRHPIGVHALVRPPVPAERRGRLRDDVVRITGDLARELEWLIGRAPEQWHVMQPNWPSDFEAEGVERGSGPVGL